MKCQVMEVICSEVAEGEGTEEDPVRKVRYFYTLDGRMLGRIDYDFGE